MTALKRPPPHEMNSAAIVEAARRKLDRATASDARADGGLAAAVACVADMAAALFDDYYQFSRAIPDRAKRAFETRDWRRAIELSKERIAAYSSAVAAAEAGLAGAAALAAAPQETLWRGVAEQFAAAMADRYEADLATAFLASLERALRQSAWRPGPRPQVSPRAGGARFLKTIPCGPRLTAEDMRAFLRAPGIEARFRDFEGDADAVARRVNQEWRLDKPGAPRLEAVEVVEAGFYRNRGAYIVGSLRLDGARQPLALALLNRDTGLEVDAVILRPTTLSHVFSSTLANFHVGVAAYHELVDYLYELMPTRPQGQHYSTIGFNHVGKLAVMEQLFETFAREGGRFDHAPGPRGSVAVAFCTPALPFVLKVIRDTPAAHYKWDSYGGKHAILNKYRAVHELNRSGSMLDNIIYANVELPRRFFDEAFLEDARAAAASSVTVAGDQVRFEHLIAQRKLIPVPLFLASCDPTEAERVVIRLGQCIRNNAAIDVFNKDLDGRNYGVSVLQFVYLFDYDAVEPLTDVKVRSNEDRDFGDEDIPDWFFEDGPVFLPEELEAHLKLPTRAMRRLFREAHGELLTAEYWRRMQGWLREGRVPRVRTYPRSTQLRLDRRQEDLVLSPLS